MNLSYYLSSSFNLLLILIYFLSKSMCHADGEAKINDVLLPEYLLCTGQDLFKTDFYGREQTQWANVNNLQSPQSCALICRSQQFTYAALRSSKCYCGQNITAVKLVVEDGLCEGRCTRDASVNQTFEAKNVHDADVLKALGRILAQRCGTRRYMAIYAVCPLQTYSQKCDHECFCRSDACHVGSGWCLNKKCQTGWTGPRCDYPDPCSNKPCRNGGECLDPTREASHEYKCVCRYGYFGDNCEKGRSEESIMTKFLNISNTEDTVLAPEIDLDEGPTFMGCFKEADVAEDFDESYLILDDKMNLETCAIHCKDKKMTYLALQSGRQCKCGTKLGNRASTAITDCNVPCPGNKAQNCGGASSMDVYSVCPIGSYNTPDCDLKCRCGDYAACTLDVGLCPGGACEEGYVGPSCSQLTFTGARRKGNRSAVDLVLSVICIYTLYLVAVPVAFKLLSRNN